MATKPNTVKMGANKSSAKSNETLTRQSKAVKDGLGNGKRRK